MRRNNWASCWESGNGRPSQFSATYAMRGGCCEANQGTEIEIAPEDPSTLEENLEDPGEVTGYADAVLSVWDDRVRRKLERGIADMGMGASRSSSSEPIDTQRCVCVVERKFNNDKFKFWAPFQGGYHAVKNNIQKGHLLSIYVLVMTGTAWSYGKLEMCGLVTLENGQVDPACMETFQSQQKLSGQGAYTYEMLQKKLEAGTTFYRKHYRDNPAAHYRDHTTLVGTFYIMSKWYLLPQTELVGGLDQPDTHRLFNGLLRLIVGDSILDWKREDYDSVCRRRKEYIRIRCRIGKQEGLDA